MPVTSKIDQGVFACPYDESFESKPILKWISSRNGSVPAGAIAAGCEKNNPHTFVGRCKLKGKRHLGRIVPADKSCYVTFTCMEHRRSSYEALVNVSSETLVWRKELPPQTGRVAKTPTPTGHTILLLSGLDAAAELFIKDDDDRGPC